MEGNNSKSHLRIFLSADLVGSTRLKNRLNHQELLEKYRARIGVLKKVQETDPDVVLSDETSTKSVLESLAVSTEDFDWATVVKYFYESFHSEFSASLNEVSGNLFITRDKSSFFPWKAIGDELIYQFPVSSRRELHHIVIAFLTALRSIDKKVEGRVSSDRGLRIKGSAWTAGFPVRNRVVNLPVIKTEDFLGPDIDTGFRIGKCTRSGMLVVSVELAELLSEVSGELNPIIGTIVGWEELKGVWNDKKYPVIWVDFPTNFSSLNARPFNVWQKEECKWCKRWEENIKSPLHALKPILEEIRETLPKSLGLVKPYILNDSDSEDEVPSEHQDILELLKLVEVHQKDIENQDSMSDPDGTGDEYKPSDDKFDDLFNF